MAYFPLCAAGLGVVSLLIYGIFRVGKKRRKNVFLIIGCTGIGLCALYFCSLFFAMYLGWFPIPN